MRGMGMLLVAPPIPMRTVIPMQMSTLSIRKSHLDLEHFRELQYFQRSHGALGASGCLSKMDIFLGVFRYLSEMAQRCIFTWVSLDIFERSLKHLSKIFQRCIVPWVSPGGFQISFRHVYLLECL